MDDLTDGQIERFCDVHIAEYNALTMRLTYWIYLQYALLVAAAADLLLVGALSKIYQGWLILFTLLILGWAILYTQDEILSTAAYIEGVLKPAIKNLPGFSNAHANSLWSWEKFLLDWRGDEFGKFEQQFGLLPVFGIGIFGVLAIVYFRYREALSNLKPPEGRWFVAWNVFWFVTCMYVIVMIVLKTIHNKKLRDELNRLIVIKPVDNTKSDASSA